MHTVLNLATGQTVQYFADSLSQQKAVRNAYAQYTRKDWNTWTYSKYDALVIEGEYTYLRGDWSILKPRN